MVTNSLQDNIEKPLCAIFGECGGCQHQDMPYSQELLLKEEKLRNLFLADFPAIAENIKPIVPSPQQYHYRSRLDLKLIKTRQQDVFVGFSPAAKKNVIPAQECPIALKAVSDFLPTLKVEATAKIPKKYRQASLVVKTGDDGRVFWGGIGRGSLRMEAKDYLWTKIHGKTVYYSLDTFFQANLSILPLLVDTIIGMDIFDDEVIFYDFYGGVGLFGICFHDYVNQVFLVEENTHAITVAHHNVKAQGLKNFNIIEGRVEDRMSALFQENGHNQAIAMIDPPRQGLTPESLALLCAARSLKCLLYLSCNPDTLVRDLGGFIRAGWQVDEVIPFDFFPKTKHLETLVLLKP